MTYGGHFARFLQALSRSLFLPIFFKFGHDLEFLSPFAILNQQNRLATSGFTKNRALERVQQCAVHDT